MRLRVLTASNAFSFVLGCSLTLFLGGIGPLGGVRERRPEKSHRFLVVLLMSAPDNLEQREAVRKTWARDIRKEDRTQLLFVVGDKNLTTERKWKLLSEKDLHNDILLLPVEDSYSGLTRKVLESFKRINEDYDFEFLLKCDDDSFVNFPPFVEAAAKMRSERLLYWGYFQGKGSVFPSGKWKETRWNICDKYIPYAYGGGYVLSRPLVRFIADNSEHLSRYRSEDVSVAAWLAGINATRVHDVRFDTMYVSRGCRDTYLIMHKQTPDRMVQLFKNLQETGRLCQEEFDTLKPYTYNWNTLPSNCCKKHD